MNRPIESLLGGSMDSLREAWQKAEASNLRVVKIWKAGSSPFNGDFPDVIELWPPDPMYDPPESIRVIYKKMDLKQPVSEEEQTQLHSFVEQNRPC